MQNEILLFTDNTKLAKEEIVSIGGAVKIILGERIFISQIPNGFDLSNLKRSTIQQPIKLDDLSLKILKGWNTYKSKPDKEAVPDNREGKRWAEDPNEGPWDMIYEDGDTLSEEEKRDPFEVRYMCGSIAVGVVVVSKRDGKEKFSDKEESKVMSEVMESISWMAHAEPSANVSFETEWYFPVIDTPPTHNCPKEPGKELVCEKPWRDAALHEMGYTNYEQIVDDLISSKGTKWGYVAFFTKYELSTSAYSNYLHRKIVLRYQNAGSLNSTFAHETFHLFCAKDEYTNKIYRCNCTSRFGELEIENGNCENCNPHHVKCVMLHNQLTMCQYTRGQIGWASPLISYPMLMVNRGSTSDHLWYSPYNGFSFSLGTELQECATATRPALAVYDGKVYCAHRGSTSDKIYYRTFDGQLWDDSDYEIPGTHTSAGPAMAVYNDKLYCVHRGSTSDRLYYKVYDGNTWVDMGKIPDTHTAVGPALAVMNDKLYCAHRGSTSDKIYYQEFNGAGWTDSKEITHAHTSSAPALAVMGNTMYCAHRGSTSDRVYLKIFRNNEWNDFGEVPNTHTSTGVGLTGYLGVLFLVHRGSTSDNLYYSKYSERNQSFFGHGKIEGMHSAVGPALVSGLPF